MLMYLNTLIIVHIKCDVHMDGILLIVDFVTYQHNPTF